VDSDDEPENNEQPAYREFVVMRSDGFLQKLEESKDEENPILVRSAKVISHTVNTRLVVLSPDSKSPSGSYDPQILPSPISWHYTSPRISTSSMAPPELDDEMKKTSMLNQDKVFEELLETEQKYFKRLQMLEFHFRREFLVTLDKSPAEAILSRKEVDRIFLNIPELMDVSESFVGELRRVKQEKIDVSELSLIMHNFEEKMVKAFGDYSMLLQESNLLTSKVLESNQRFKKFVAVQAKALNRT